MPANISNHMKSFRGDLNLSSQGTFPQWLRQTTKFPTTMPSSQRKYSASFGMKGESRELKKSKITKSRNFCKRVVVFWLLTLMLGLIILVFGKPDYKLTVIGAITIGLGFGILIGCSLCNQSSSLHSPF